MHRCRFARPFYSLEKFNRALTKKHIRIAGQEISDSRKYVCVRRLHESRHESEVRADLMMLETENYLFYI